MGSSLLYPQTGLMLPIHMAALSWQQRYRTPGTGPAWCILAPQQGSQSKPEWKLRGDGEAEKAPYTVSHRQCSLFGWRQHMVSPAAPGLLQLPLLVLCWANAARNIHCKTAVQWSCFFASSGSTPWTPHKHLRPQNAPVCPCLLVGWGHLTPLGSLTMLNECYIWHFCRLRWNILNPLCQCGVTCKGDFYTGF